MTTHTLQNEIFVYTRWRDGLTTTIERYHSWLERQQLVEDRLLSRLNEISREVKSDRLNVAFVAEYSRGKSELINAIFFGSQRRRVLPANAGRTTMCPTELRYDPAIAPCIRLLPIETRASETPLSEYEERDYEWTTFSLPLDDPDRLAEELSRVTDVTRVTPKQAHELGLQVEDPKGQNDGEEPSNDSIVLIPRWRHAVINYPHPLLEQGLVILDTPGLNALGAEPELTFGMLSNAHAVIFLLAADTGVTKSDLAVWQDHVCAQLEENMENKLVVLNKIDVLWDELRDARELSEQLQNQVQDTTTRLNVAAKRVFPLSAQKALLGRVKRDPELIRRSGIEQFEKALADTLVPNKRNIVRTRIHNELTDLINETQGTLHRRVNEANNHRQDLEQLAGRNEEVTSRLMVHLGEEKTRFSTNFKRYQASRAILSEQTNHLFEHLDLNKLDTLIQDCRNTMTKSFTTVGMRQSMRRFLEIATSNMEAGAVQIQEISEMAAGLCHLFETQHGIKSRRVKQFSTSSYQREIRNIGDHQDRFVRGLGTLMTEQHVLAKRYYHSVMSRVRRVFERANQEAQSWTTSILSPLETEIREHNAQLRRRVEGAKRVYRTGEDIEGRLFEIRHQHEKLQLQLNDLREFERQIEGWMQEAHGNNTGIYAEIAAA